MKENEFQKNLIKKIKNMLPNAIVLKMDPTYKQGIPDLLILNNEKWAALEVKKNAKASKRPNQQYYVDKMDAMSYARFISPENEKEVLDEIQRTL